MKTSQLAERVDMASKRSPICFVAMAFGHHDTDVLYDVQISLLLRDYKIRPIRIDRRQSNKDLNIQIFEQIDSADLCIVDLTYARPSVYFEAGFAEKRKIPVIYTARKDHLGKGQPDNLRVHFDLQMKPIIVWEDVNDTAFSSRLKKRIRHTFLNSWNQKQEVSLKHSHAESEFQKLPTLVRMGSIRRDTIKLLRNAGFSYWSVYDFFNGNNSRGEPPKPFIYRGVYNHTFGHKIENAKMYFASIHTYTSPSKTDLLYIGKDLVPSFTRDLIDAKDIRQFVASYFVINLENVTPSRIENALHMLVPVGNGVYYQDFRHVSRWVDFGKKTLYLRVNYVFLSGIKSTLQLNERLRPIIHNLFPKSNKM